MTFYDNEVPSGLVNGTNATFTLVAAPDPATSLLLLVNGVVQSAGVDYDLSGNTITFLSGSIPQSGDSLRAWYRVEGVASQVTAAAARGYYRDDAVALIQDGLGNRSGEETRIIRAMKAAQAKLEARAELPWFLQTQVDVASSTSPLAVPDTMLAEVEDPTALWIVEDDGSLTPVYKKDFETLSLNPNLKGTGKPQFYALVGSYRYLFPQPDKSYTFRTLYYSVDSPLDTNIKNAWLTFAPNLLIAEAGFMVARNLRDAAAMQFFDAERKEALVELDKMSALHESGSMHEFMGG